MRQLLGQALLCVALVLPAAADTGLDPLARRDALLGWEAVGRVDIGEKGFCTGTLIATDLVLTAAHCLFDRKTGQPEDIGAIRFRAGLTGDSVIAESGVARAVANPDYDPRGPTDAQNVSHDVALLQLADPIPAAVAAPFLVASPDGLSEVSIVSYAQGRENALSWQKSCTVLGQRDGLIGFSCDVDFGSSGAPVFDRSGSRARIVAIVSAGNRDGNRVTAYGMVLASAVDDLKAALRSGRGVLDAGAAAPPAAAIRRVGSAFGSGTTGAHFVTP